MSPKSGLFIWPCLLCSFVLAVSGGNSEEVSFFGSSHVSVRLQEARSYSDIYFRLRTRRSDSMIFLAAGRTDYCLLVLDAGRLKVHINLGAGETEIASEAPFLLNDMKWHTVNLTRRGSQLTIQVDHHFTKANLPSRFHELNIHFGVWLGGLAGFNEIFLGNLPSFRGCMSHITYNSEDVLLRAKTQPGEISGVAWNCSEEFDASPSDPFSFQSSSSYVIARAAIPRQGTVVKMNVRPVQGNGLIFYVSGVSSRPDYLALELRDGKAHFVAEMGSGPIHIRSTADMTDHRWHSITLHAAPSLLSVTIDNQTWTAESAPRGASRHLDVSEVVFLGGIEDSKQSKLRSLGLIDQSFAGCISEFSIDGTGFGLPEADVTRNVSRGCPGSESSSSDAFCSPNLNAGSGNCSQDGHGSGLVLSNNNRTNSTTSIMMTTTNNGGDNGTRSSLDVITIPRDVIRVTTQTAIGELEIMRLSPVQVAEGDSVIITPRHLAITLDLSKFGIRESGVLFRVSKPPHEGRLEVTSRAAGSSRSETFAFLDVGAGRVRYFHGGSESSRDSIELVLRLVQTKGFLLPAYLQDERVLTLPVEITAVNDPPEIRLVPGGVLRLAQGTKIRLLPEVITSLDPDTDAKDLQFTVMSMGSPGEATKGGFLELSSEPGKAIQSFTQEDLLNKRVWYVDRGQSSSKMALKVTDGSSVSPTAVLRIETFSLRIAPEINTGLEVANVLGVTVISSSNLSFTSNAGDQGLIIEYHIIKGPRAGSVQLKRTNGQWANAEHFTQMDLANKGVRYLLQRPSEIPTEDEFTFHVSLSEVKVPSEFRFRLRIIALRVEVGGLNSLLLNGTTESLISSRQLEYRTFPVSTPDTELKYTIVQPPRYGVLFYRPSPPSSSTQNNSNNKNNKILSTFTQADLSSKRIFFQFRLTPYSALKDHFLFNITTPHVSGGPFQMTINHTTSRKPYGVTLKPLSVTEGSREIITSSILSIKINSGDSRATALPVLFFNITNPSPTSGFLGVRQTVGRGQIQSVAHFTSVELEKNMVFYQHDGSESPKDKIPLVAWSTEANFIFETTLDVIVRGVNNHAPIRNPAATLAIHVVIGGRRRLGVGILDFVDKDWDSERRKLKYTCTAVVPRAGAGFLGNIYDTSASWTQPIFTWTQADIDAGKLIFQHEGTDTHGFLYFWVTDGKFTVNGTLEISAGAPWVRIVNTTTLAGRRGSMERLSEGSIRVETNVDVDQERILIRIVGGPQNGIIRMNNKAALNFTLGDVSQGLVAYESEGPTTDGGRDSFQFSASVDGQAESDVAELDIAIFSEAYWTPLTVDVNDGVTVNENSSAIITQAHLHVNNPHIPPTDIVYTLTRPPRYGYLAIEPTQSYETGTDDYVQMWDQTVINDGRLRYVQSEPNKTLDSMNFDVTNGVHTLRDLRLDFMIVPATLFLASNPLIVHEGSSVGLNITHLHSAQNYFADKLSEVRITDGPKHGTLGMISRPRGPLLSFPYKALEEGKIVYTHDGAETLLDHFTVIAQTVELGMEERKSNISSSRISHPHQVHVQILPSNDQVPKVINNTGTWVWNGSTVIISSSELAAIDEDSDGNELTFYVVGVRGGIVATADHPARAINNFTQDDINQSKIAFAHSGYPSKGTTTELLIGPSFDFEVSDGLNEASKETFKISIRKPELVEYEGRVKLPVFPLTQAPLRPENLLVRSNDGREINFQATSGPAIGQLLIERSENNFSPVAAFTQTDVNNGKIFYQHLKVFRGQRANDSVRFTATSRYAEPLYNVTVEMDISVSGAALGGLQRYVAIQALSLKEGSQVAITNRNVNLSAVVDFINMHHKGSLWRGGTPSLRLIVAEGPKNGWLFGPDGTEQRLVIGTELSLSSLANGLIKYQHDDSETTTDSIGLSLWFWTNDTATSTWLLNATLPISITPVNDQPFQISAPKGPIAFVIQEHSRKLSRSDLLTSDPDTPPAHLVYEVTKISHGRFLLQGHDSEGSLTPSAASIHSREDELNSKEDHLDLKDLPTIVRFTQADVDAGRVIFHHTGPVSPVLINLRVTDGHFSPSNLALTIPVQLLTLAATPGRCAPLRIQQGKTVSALSAGNLISSTNGQLFRLSYNVSRAPLHGKILLRDGSYPERAFHGNPAKIQKLATTFNHYELLGGEIVYVATDVSVANDSFEVGAYFNFEMTGSKVKAHVATSWLVNVVAVPLLRRVQEIDYFGKMGFAVGGVIAPDEFEFSAAAGGSSTLNLAVLDASPLAALTGSNPHYEILLPPTWGQIFKISAGNLNHVTNPARIVSRFSHEDVRRGSIIYTPSTKLLANEILPFAGSAPAATGMLDEFIFKVLAPGVQPALGVARFNIKSTSDSRGFYDDKNSNQIISGSTDPATKRSGGGNGGGMRDLLSVSPNLSKESLITVGVILAGVVTLTLFLIVGIRCSCSKKAGNRRRRNSNSQCLNNGGNDGHGGNSKMCGNGIGIIDVYAPSTTCTLLDPSCQDSECSRGHHGHGRPSLLLSPLSPRSRHGHKVGNSRTASESGSWTSSGLRTDGPTPSIPQCRVTPLCGGGGGAGSLSGGSDSGGCGYSSSGGNGMMLCPLLPPTPICDTFAPLPEEIDPPEPYGFTYGAIASSLPPPSGYEVQGRGCVGIEETEFRDFHSQTGQISNIMLPGNNGGGGGGGTLRRNNPGKNQYWV